MTLPQHSLQPLSVAFIEAQLEELLNPVLSSRRTAHELAIALATLSRGDQQFILNWLKIITKTNSEMGYQFMTHATRALGLMDRNGIQRWILHAMDIYDHNGLYPGSEALAKLEEFAIHMDQQSVSANLSEIEAIISRYVRGLSGRTLNIAQNNNNEWFTDTETIWLPAEVHRYRDRRNNFIFYKVIAVHLWAQIHYGTFRRRMPSSRWLSEKLQQYPEPIRARQVFNTLETYRLDACITRELPGLAREMQELMVPEVETKLTRSWGEAVNIVEASHSSVTDTLDQVAILYRRGGTIPTSKPWQGALRPEKAEETTRKRIMRESIEARECAWSVKEKLTSDQLMSIVKPSIMNKSDVKEHQTWKINPRGNAVIAPQRLSNIFQSALLDFEEIPSSYLLTDMADDSRDYDAGQRFSESSETNDSDEPSGYCYDEWDFQRGSYRKNWCFLREIDMQPSQEPVVDQTLDKYKGLVLEIRRTFEAIRGGNRKLKRQTNGDDIDIEALVDAQTQTKAGQEVSDQLFTSSRRIDRDTAVIFMVDISGSTKGWINCAERESLVLLCEAIEILGDEYAIYAFSGMTRKRCELYRIKSFGEAYSEDVKKRIAGIEPKDYTRMGVIIRHLTKLLGQMEARTRLLVTLSDGKPDDYDGYRGEYGVEDTRQALVEARRAGIYPFCITIDKTARDYLPHMYGEAGYTVVSDVKKLPKRVSEIYRRLTT